MLHLVLLVHLSYGVSWQLTFRYVLDVTLVVSRFILQTTIIQTEFVLLVFLRKSLDQVKCFQQIRVLVVHPNSHLAHW